MNKIVFGIIVFTLVSVASFSQGALPSNTFVKTNFHDHDCFANDNASYLFFNELSRELSIVVDFAKCKVGHDTIDAWLDDIDENKLLFTGVVTSDKLLELTNSNSKTIKINGKIKFNNILVNKEIEITFFEISKEGMLYRNNGNDYYDRIRAMFQIELSPKDYKVDKKLHKLKNVITVSVGNGYVNPFKPETEEWFNNNFK